MPLPRPYEQHGDKENSSYFKEYLEKIYDWRDSVGLVDLIHEMHSVVIEVDEADRHSYIEELMLMTPYQFVKSYENEHFTYSLLEISQDNPAYIIRSRKNRDKSKVYSMNHLSPVALQKPYTRYIGEVYRVTDLQKVYDILLKAGVEFETDGIVTSSKTKFVRTVPSQFTWNTVAYIEYPEGKRQYYLEQFADHPEDQAWLEKVKAIKVKQSELKISELIQPIDHLATRVLHQDREHALLEYIKLTSYYFWGAYEIADQNSSTNVTRSAHDYAEFKSPARVFTAANTPHYVDHIVKLPSPTESFVINYGKRMHHIAYGVADNTKGQSYDNVDFVVDRLKENGIEFLLQVIGSAEEGLKQIFSRTSKHSLLITEYVQRFNGFQGFFTKKNVAFLTQAAGEDAMLKKKEGRMGEKDIFD
jgi:hypothetical protein